MPRKCSVTTCSSEKKDHKVTLFKVPTTEEETWNEIIRRENGNEKCKIDYVCTEHFKPEDLVSTYVNVTSHSFRDICSSRQRFGLKKGAIPSVFKKPQNIIEPLINRVCPMPELENAIVSFEHFLNTDILLPIGWKLSKHVEIISIYKLVHNNLPKGLQIVVEKQIVFCPDNSSINYYVNQKKVEPVNCGLVQLSYPLHTSQVIDAIKLFQDKIICQGGPKFTNFLGIKVQSAHIDNTFWRSNICSVLIDSKQRCKRCNILFPYFRTYKKRSLKPRLKYIKHNLGPINQKLLNKALREKTNLEQNNCT